MERNVSPRPERSTGLEAGPGSAKRGFSLLELMVAMAILAAIAAVAVPAYRGYVENAATSVLMHGIATMAAFQEEARLSGGVYVSGAHDPARGDTSLAAAIGWRPANDDAVYVVDASAETSYRVTATDAQGRTICRIMPARTPC